MTVTIREVARATGLSVATISRVLNGKSTVREETRRKVMAAAARLHWAPHGAARSLNTKVTKNVGVVLPDIYGEFFSELIRGIDLAARGHGFHLLVSSSHSNRSETEEVLRAMRGRVDGVVVMSPTIDAKDLRDNVPAALPAVLLNCVAGKGFDSISVDNYGGAWAMARHLSDLGHRRIAFVAGPSGNHDAEERRRGFRDGLRASWGAPRGEWEVAGDFSEESGFRAGKEILCISPRPTAIFAANDAMAVGCLACLEGAGIEVPDSMALAGFDDIPIARFVSPPLTTVRVPIGELGARAMERLLAALDHGPAHVHQHETMTTTLVVRESCGAHLPPGRDRAPRAGKPHPEKKEKT